MTTHFATVPITEIDDKQLTIHTTPPAPYVLVVDDEPVLADSLTRILRTAGYAAATAYDAETALALAELAPPQFLVSDVRLPGMDGIELAIRLCRSIPDCKVLLISADDPIDRLTGPECSGYRLRFLRKPFHPERLLHELSAVRATPPGSVPRVGTDKRDIHLVL
jgi:DNA-binding response OmpR family regulator